MPTLQHDNKTIKAFIHIHTHNPNKYIVMIVCRAVQFAVKMPLEKL